MSNRVVSFVGAKGGSGTSTVALEVARALRRNQPIAIVDADLTGRRNLAVMLDAVRLFDEKRGQDGVPVIECEGFRAAELVNGLISSFSLRAKSVEQLDDALAACETIVVDVPQPFAGAVQPLVARTSRFLIVMEPTVLGIASARSFMTDAFANVDRGSIAAVLNHREAGPSELSRRDVEGLLGIAVAAEVPNRSDRNFPKAIAALAAYVGAIPVADTPLNLMISNTPIGERRSDVRREEMRLEARALDEQTAASGANSRTATINTIKAEIHAALGDEIDAATAATMSDAGRVGRLREKVSATVRRLVATHSGEFSIEAIQPLCEEIIAEALGLGPLEDLMARPDVSEIMVNGPDTDLRRAERQARTHRQTFRQRAAAAAGHRTHRRAARPPRRRILADGRRAPAGRLARQRHHRAAGAQRPDDHHPPVRDTQADDRRPRAPSAPSRPQVVRLLRAAIEARLNIVISGGTGSGKTTFLNMLSGFIPPASASSRSRTPPSCSSASSTSCGSNRGRRTSKAKARSASATW